MIDFDPEALERVLPDTPGSADWDDVLGRSRAQQGRRRRYIAVLAVMALAIVGTASAVGVRAFVLDTGPTSLPPEGAMPSTPESAELVIHYDGRPGIGAPVAQVWVYDDGRVIRRSEGGPVGVADESGEVRTGLLEQRLSREGVELLVAEVRSTGLFDRNRVLGGLGGIPHWGLIQVRDGEQMTTVVFWGGGSAPFATLEQARELRRLAELLADPAASLPTSAWTDPEVTAYVPSKYAICYWRPWAPPAYEGQAVESSRILGFLPSAARDLLRGKDKTYDPFLTSDAPGFWILEGNRYPSCAEVTTAEARALDETLSEAGVRRVSPGPDSPPAPAATGLFELPAPADVIISFEPVLPHGQWAAMGG